MDIVERLREHNEPPFDYIAHEAAAKIERLQKLLQNWMGCCFVDEKRGDVTFGMGVKKVWAETRAALKEGE